MADRTVEADVIVNDKTAAGLDSASRRVKKFGDDVDKESKRAGDNAGKNLGGRIGDGFGKATQSIGVGVAKIGALVGGKLGDAIGDSVSNASPQIQGAIGAAVIGAVATLAPLIGGALSAAVVGGAAGVGIIGGVLLAARDARVQTAAASLGQRIMTGLNAKGGVFLEPVLASLGMISDRFNALLPVIGRGFQAASRFVVPLTDALLDAGEAITRGLVTATTKAGPVIDAIGDGVRQVGQAIGDVFTVLSGQSENAASALRVVFTIIAGAIRVIGDFVYALTAAWGAIRTLGGLLGDDSAGVGKVEPDAQSAADGLGALIPALDETQTGAAGAAASMQALIGASSALAQANASLDQSQIALNAALAATKQVREEGGRVTDNERNSLLQLNSEISSHLEKMAATGASADQVNAKSNQLRASFIEQARAMGMSEQQATELAARYGLFPKTVDTKVVLSGAAQAARELEYVKAAAGDIPAAINIAVRVTGSSNVAEVARSLAKQSMMADARADAYAEGSASFASLRGGRTGTLAGARTRSEAASLYSEVKVELDGRQIAPSVTTIARILDKRMAWREKRTRR